MNWLLKAKPRVAPNQSESAEMSCETVSWLIPAVGWRHCGNQTYIVLTFSERPGLLARQPNQWPMTKSKEQSKTSTGCLACCCLKRKGQIKEMCFRTFLDSCSWASWEDRQWEVVSQGRDTRVKALVPVLVLMLGTDSDSLVWSKREWWEWCG